MRLLREAQHQAKLVHPCICQIYDVGPATTPRPSRKPPGSMKPGAGGVGMDPPSASRSRHSQTGSGHQPRQCPAAPRRSGCPAGRRTGHQAGRAPVQTAPVQNGRHTHRTALISRPPSADHPLRSAVAGAPKVGNATPSLDPLSREVPHLRAMWTSSRNPGSATWVVEKC